MTSGFVAFHIAKGTTGVVTKDADTRKLTPVAEETTGPSPSSIELLPHPNVPSPQRESPPLNGLGFWV